MRLRNKIQQSREYQEAAATATDTAQQGRQADSVAEAVDPVVSLEKSDVQFWMQVAQVVILLLIWRELASRGGL